MMKPNSVFLNLLIITCCLMMGSSDLKIQVNSSDSCFWNGNKLQKQAINLTCLPVDGEKQDLKKINVKLNISSQGQMQSIQCKVYSFNITKYDNQFKVRMKETVAGVQFGDCSSSDSQLGEFTFEQILEDLSYSCPSFNNIKVKGCSTMNSFGDLCRNASSGDETCGQNNENNYILTYNNNNNNNNNDNNNNQKCETCTQRPVLSLPEVNLTDASGRTDPSKASDVMKSLETKMNNISTAVIVMGNVIGLLYVQDKSNKTKDMCFSSDKDNINIADCRSVQNTGLSWSVKIPIEAFNKSRLKNNGSEFVGILPFTNMGNENKTQNYTILNDEVYGITMKANIFNLTNNIEMFFSQTILVGKASCSSWDGKGNLSWTTSGCETQKIDSDTIKCSCSHLTFFAVLMSPNVDKVDNLETLTLISSIGCGISMFFLSIALFMHFLLRKAKSNQAMNILMNTFVALFLLNSSFLSNESVANSGGETECVFIALLMHYSMLATFTWFFIQALHMYLWLIRKNVSITNYMRKITVFGWVFASPAVIAVVSIGGYGAITLPSSTGKISRMCWITDPLIIYIVNIGFYVLVFIFTSGIFIMIVFKIFQARHIRATDGKRITFRKLLMMVMSLFLLFGLTWAVVFFSYGAMRTPSFYIFGVVNGLLGFLLFLYYVYIHNDIGGRFSDDPKSSGSITSITPSNTNAEEHVYDN